MTFNAIFSSNDSQEKIFQRNGDIAVSVVNSTNAGVLVFGESGTGKSFTLNGDSANPGLIPRTLDDLFQRVDTFNAENSGTQGMSVTSQCFELYNGNMYDLFWRAENANKNLQPPVLEIQPSNSGVNVLHAVEPRVFSADN
jgi:hypothetical protein